jgi:pimeloyl-ACP methyl ester carboxylesterase
MTETETSRSSGQRLVEVDNGLRLMIGEQGSGSPPVVCLSCAGGAHEEWSQVAARLSPLTRVVTYGRPGLGGSDPLGADQAGRLQSIGWAALQLRSLLRNAGLEPPYVLLTSSIGSWIADQYAALRPKEVAGMVLVDPTMASRWEVIIERDLLVDGDEDEPGGLRFEWNACYAELARSVPAAGPRRVVVSGSDGRWERDSVPSAWHQPLTLSQVDQRWQASQGEWVQRLGALHVVADTAGHFVHREQPDLVAYVTTAVVDAARAGAPVDLDAAGVAAQAGQLRL